MSQNLKVLHIKHEIEDL